MFDRRWSVERERGVLEIGPLTHRTVIVANVLVAEQPEDERGDRRANTALSIGDGFGFRIDGTRQPEVADLQIAILIHEQIPVASVRRLMDAPWLWM